MTDESPIGVRRATPEDLVFVRSSWFHSALKTVYLKKKLPFAFYRAGMNDMQDYQLKRSLVYVAFAREMPTEIIGYAVLEGANCHWLYVKSVFRRQGVGRALLGSRVHCYTHETTGAGLKFFEALRIPFNPKAGEPV